MARRRKRRVSWGFSSVRDVILFTIGAAGIAYETLVSELERPTLLIVFAGLLGLPLVFREQKRTPPDQDKPDTDASDSEGDGTR